MKNLFLSALLVLTVSFAFGANDIGIISTFDVEKTVEPTNSVELVNADFSMEITNSLEVGGLCCITIYDSGGNTVYHECLPANTSEACEQMLEDILAAMQ